jgi:hypothetical protein
LLLVQIADKKGDKKGLKELYEKVYALAPDNETVLYNLAVEYEMGTEERAFHFETYLKNHPKDVKPFASSSICTRRRKKKSPPLRLPGLCFP